MPVAVVQDWVEEETDRSTVNYDAISERLGAMEDPPKGMLMHSAGFTGSGFRIFEVWETPGRLRHLHDGSADADRDGIVRLRRVTAGPHDLRAAQLPRGLAQGRSASSAGVWPVDEREHPLPGVG